MSGFTLASGYWRHPCAFGYYDRPYSNSMSTIIFFSIWHFLGINTYFSSRRDLFSFKNFLDFTSHEIFWIYYFPSWYIMKEKLSIRYVDFFPAFFLELCSELNFWFSVVIFFGKENFQFTMYIFFLRMLASSGCVNCRSIFPPFSPMCGAFTSKVFAQDILDM